MTIQNKPPSKEYMEGWDRIYGKQRPYQATRLLDGSAHMDAEGRIKCKKCNQPTDECECE